MSDIDQRIERLRERYTPRRHANHYSHGDPDVLAVCAEVERLRRERQLSVDRDYLGQIVRKAWVEWAKDQPNRKPSWLVPWKELSEADREADRRIGESVASQCVNPELLRVEAELERLRAVADKIRLFAQSALYWYASAGSQRVASTPRINHSGATWILRMIRDSEEKPPEGIDQQEEAT